MMRRLLGARFVADFDSSAAMVRAVGRHLTGRDFPALGVGPESTALAAALARLPAPARRRATALVGATRGVPLHLLRRLRDQDLAQWVVAQYPRGPYPAVVVGSASGAAVHLCAALGAPYLPQTLLTLVRQRGIHPDEPQYARQAASALGHQVVAANPDLQLHHMHDPNQDRPMLEHAMYFRLKRRRLGSVFARFLEERLAPGGEIILLECARQWPTTSVGDRYVFQFGALGGISESEYLEGNSPRIEGYLRDQGSHQRSWQPPAPDGHSPEAEWGFDPALREDVERLATTFGLRVRRVVVDEPDLLSPLVADLYRWWYRRLGLPANRLLVESYVQWDPHLALRVGAVPYWMRFNHGTDRDRLERYLDDSDPYDQIHLNLFSPGIDAVDTVPIDQWRTVTARARKHGQLIGVDEQAYPSDLGGSLRYHSAYASLRPRYPIPAPLTPADLDSFLRGHGSLGPVTVES